MKICFIITRSENCGGANVYVRELAKLFIEKGDNAIILAGENGPFFDELSKLNIPFMKMNNLIRPIHPLTDSLAFFEIRKTLKKINPDIVSTNSSKAGLIGRLAAKSLKLPVTFTAHGWAFSEGIPEAKRKIYILIERFAAKFCDKIITVSEYDRNLAIKEGICNQHKLVTIHNGMPDISESFIAHPDKSLPTITMIARFQEQKDHRTLLRALAGLKELEWQLNLVGDGPLKSKMEELALNLHIKEKCSFLGNRNDVPAILSKTQIFVLISNWEGFPISILEAMRSGLPVIASDVGGVKEALIHDKTGYLVGKNDSDELKTYLSLLIQSSSKRKLMGINGRSFFLENFLVEKMACPTKQTFQQILEQQIH
jgi:glycosyltransferase involved in cell wall biosynthesis